MCLFLLFVGVPLLSIPVDVRQCACFSRRFSYCILKYECIISVRVCYKCVLGMCMCIFLPCWRAGAWDVVRVPVACPEIQNFFVGIEVCIGSILEFIGCSLPVFLTLCFESSCLYEELRATGAVCVGLNVLYVLCMVLLSAGAVWILCVCYCFVQ
jgi:hypothetical protein